MSHDLKVMNKLCDHKLRGIRCFVSGVDGRTLLPRRDASVFLLADPVNVKTAELSRYNPISRESISYLSDDPEYGWDIYNYPIIPDRPEFGTATQVKFKKRQRSTQGVWLLSHQASSSTCIKCGGSKTVSDITLLNDPDKALFVENEAKLAQDFIKMLLTPRGSNPYYPWIGTSLVDLPGMKFSRAEIEAKIGGQIVETATSMKTMQAQQAAIAAQQVNPREMLSSVTSVTFDQAASDPRTLLIRIELYTMSKTLTTLQFPLAS